MAIQEEIRKGRDINGRFLIIGDLFLDLVRPKDQKTSPTWTKGVELKGTGSPSKREKKARWDRSRGLFSRMISLAEGQRFMINSDTDPDERPNGMLVDKGKRYSRRLVH